MVDWRRSDIRARFWRARIQSFTAHCCGALLLAACLPEGVHALPEAGTTTRDAVNSTGEPELPTEESSSDSSTFVPPTDDVGTGIFRCDIWAHDCPAGEKCMPWSSDGGSAWSGTRCSPIAAEPAGIGEPCHVEGSEVSGLDDCELASMCWDVNPETNEGTCVPLCVGDSSRPLCSDPNRYCRQAAGGVLNICLPTCDPLLQDCPEGQVCHGTTGPFVCSSDVSGGRGLNEACEYHSYCPPGLQCMSSEGHPCEPGALACCRPFCEVGTYGPPCAATEECVPWFEDANAPARWEDVGYCAFPEL